MAPKTQEEKADTDRIEDWRSPTGFWQAEYDPDSGELVPLLDEDQSGDYISA